ncbi:MAG: hypothetical protein GY757_01550 [bacterium]|nr:hypothetical protein [bacterium]
MTSIDLEPIEGSLTLVTEIIDIFRKTDTVDVVLIGAYAMIAHGIRRNTNDVDFYIYSEKIRSDEGAFYEQLQNVVPDNFEMKFIEGSNIPGDLFLYDVVILIDKKKNYPTINLFLPRFDWQIEGIKLSKPLENITMPVLPLSYVIATKLRAGAPKDDDDIITMYSRLSEEEKKKAADLALLINKKEKYESIINSIN